MKTLNVFLVAAVVTFLAICRGDRYGKSRDVENDFQDRMINKVNERREQMKSMFDPSCITWTRRKTDCLKRKRNFGAQQVIDSTDTPLEDIDYYE